MHPKRRIWKNTGRAWLSLCVIFLSSGHSLAVEKKFFLTPYLDYSYSNNIFRDSSRISDSTYSPGLELNWNTRRFNFFLDADNKIYQNNDYLNQTTIHSGFSLYRALSMRSTLFFSPEFTLTSFKGDMSFLNTAIPSLAVGLKHVFSTQLYSRFGLTIRQSDYLEEDSYDRLRLAAFLEMSAFFRTQTTLRLTLGMNYLLFPHVNTTMPTVASASLRVMETDPLVAAAESHSRRGNPDPPPPVPPTPPPPDPPTPPDPPNPPDPPAPLPEPQVSTTTTAIDLSIPQPFFVFRVAQGLGYKTGLILEILYRRNQSPLQGLQAISASEWALEQMDEDFFWQGTRFSLGLKTEALLDLEIAMDFSFLAKQYQGIDALDLAGLPVQPQAFRQDKLSQVNLKITKTFGALGLFITGNFRKNISNDLYFQYHFFTLSGGLDYSF